MTDKKEIEIKSVTSVTLADGRVVTRRNPRVREIAKAQEKKPPYDQYAVTACNLMIDGKPAVFDDILDLTQEDMIQLGDLFPEGEEKN
jgi:hypothetical protein